MKRLILIVTMLFMAFTGMASETTVQIGEGTTSSFALPFATYFHYSLVEQIYTASEIGRSGYITSISFNYNSYTTCDSYVKVYLKHTTKSSFSSSTDIEAVGQTNQYFYGHFFVNSPGWVTIELDRPFFYNGSSNLLVCFYDPFSGYAGSNCYFYHTENVGYKTIAYYHDTKCPDLGDLANYGGNKARLDFRSNIRITFTNPESHTYENTIEIGNGTSSDWFLPVNTYYNYSLSQMIYTAEEIGESGNIYTISFYHDYEGSFSMEGVRVYMKNINKQKFNDQTDMVPFSSNAVRYFDGTVSANGSGWVTINLMTPFHYDGISNLLVCFYDPTDGYPGDDYVFRYTETSDYTSITYYSDYDTQVPNITNPSNYSGNKARKKYRPDIKFGFTPGTVVGVGHSTANSTYHLPINTYYHYSLTQQIFTSSEIGTAGFIHSLAFFYQYTQPFYMTGIKVYLKHVDKTVFESQSDYVPISINDQYVFSGTLQASGQGYTTIILDQPFEYDGTSNLLVCLYDQYDGYLGNSYQFFYTPTSGYSSLVYYSDSYVPDIDNLSSYSGYKSILQYRSNIRFGITPTVSIGNGTTTHGTVPFNHDYNYSFVEQLYTADEIGPGGVIKNIYFNTASSTSYYVNVTVYMKNVKRSRFTSSTDYEAVTPSDVVFEGEWMLHRGWNAITLDVPFEYDGTSNLLIAIDENSSGYVSRTFNCTSKTGATLGYFSDTYNPNPYNLSSFNGNRMLYDYHANLWLDITPFPTDYCRIPQNVTVAALQPNSAYITWDTEGEITWVNFKKTTDFAWDGFWATSPLTITEYYPDGVLRALEPGATYEFSLASKCSENYFSPHTPIGRFTLPVTGGGANLPVNFETGYIYEYPFNNNVSAYPWVVTNSDHYYGQYCMRSSNQGVHSSISAIEATYTYEQDGFVSFYGKCMGESASSGYAYDKCIFFIDDDQMFNWGAQGDVWRFYGYPVTAGTHTFRWEYNKDTNTDPEGDAFMVDYINFGLSPSTIDITYLNTNSVMLDWDGDDEFYGILWKPNGSTEWTTMSTNYFGHTLTIPNLPPGTYQVGVYGVSAPTHTAFAEFTIAEVLSTAQWFGYAKHVIGGDSWQNKFINFTMQDPSTVVAVSNSLSAPTWAATFAQGYVWGITTQGDLFRAHFDNSTYNIEYFQTIATGVEEDIAYEMSYNPVNGLIYYVTHPYIDSYFLKCFNPNNYSGVTTIGQLSYGQAFAINNTGQAYCISSAGNLYTVDLTSATTIAEIGPTGVVAGERPQSMAFDMETGELFWSQANMDLSVEQLYKVNTETGTAAYIGTVGSEGAEVIGLFMYSNINEAPVSADFESGNLYQLIFNNDISNYPWTISRMDAASGNYSMSSSNKGLGLTNSSIEATCHFAEDGYVSFDAKCMGETSGGTNYDRCVFSIDNVIQFEYGAHGDTWDQYVYQVTAGTHTFEWTYVKDNSVNPEGDVFYVDNLEFGLGTPCVAPTHLTAMLTTSSATLSWDGSAPLYKLQYRLGGGSWITKPNLTDNTYTLDNLTPGTYEAKVWAICDPSHVVSTTFTITEILSTAQWYGFAEYADDAESWQFKFINFTMQNPSAVTAASNTLSPRIWAATYANGYVWGVNTVGDLVRTTIDNDTHTLGNFETIATGIETENAIEMSYNPVDGLIYYIVSPNISSYQLRCFNPNNYTGVTNIGEFAHGRAFAINNEGVAYCIGIDGNLYTVDLTDVSTTLVGHTGIDVSGQVQSMAFDSETGELFWAQTDRVYDRLYKVDPSNGTATYIGVIGNAGAELPGLFMVPEESGMEQDIAMTSGWNWVSSYLEYNENSLTTIEEGLSNSGVFAIIKSQNSFVSNDNAAGIWSGSLTTLENESMYMFQLSSPYTLTLNGMMANPSQHPITLNVGWNWIAFLSSQEMALTTALASIRPSNGDIIKGQDGFSQFSAAQNIWYGSLNLLAPSDGYMYLNNGVQKTLVYPGFSKDVVEIIDRETHWNYDVHEFAHNLSTVVTLDPSAFDLKQGRFEIGAFVNGTCRGAAHLDYLEGLDRYVAFLPVSGEDGDNVCFKLYDTDAATEFPGVATEWITFTSDALHGSLDNPMMLHFGNTSVNESDSQVSLFPNPTKDKVFLRAADIQTVKLFNALGQCLYSEEFDHATQVELNLSAFSAGVYTITVRTFDGKNSNLRVVRQ